MTCSYPESTIEDVISFHGHSCPGLAIGIRAAEYAKTLFKDTGPENLVCVTETDMCGVDAIQFLTGCTFGKGNLIHLDYGKAAFTFFDRSGNKAVRLVLREGSRESVHDELRELMAKSREGTISEKELQRIDELRNRVKQGIMEKPFEELFSRQDLDNQPPRPARVLKSLQCEDCKEMTMESRTRRFSGKTLCIPCFAKVEQKR